MTKLVVVSYTQETGEEKQTRVVDVRRLSDKFSEEEERAVILEGIKKLPEDLKSELSTTFASSASLPLPKRIAQADSSSGTGESAAALPHESSKKSRIKDGRVRSTFEMTSFLLTQVEKYDLFDLRTAKEEKSILVQNWERARLEFNSRFKTNVDMAAFKRKIVHLRKSGLQEETAVDAAAVSKKTGSDTMKKRSKKKRLQEEDSETDQEDGDSADSSDA